MAAEILHGQDVARSRIKPKISPTGGNIIVFALPD